MAGLRTTGPVVRAVEEAGALSGMGARTLVGAARAPRYTSEIIRQCAQMLRRTSILLFVMCGFIGMSAVNAAYFFLRSIGASDFLGAVIGFGTPRLLATTMFGYVFSATVCCGFSAELGAMRVNQEVEAYESTGIDPIRYLVGTRICAVLLYAPIAALIAIFGVLGGSYFASVILLKGIASSTFLDLNWSVQTISDQLFGIVTMTSMALVTSIISCFYGLRTRGGPDAVGDSVARGLVVNLVVLHLLSASFAVIYYGTNIRLPIGG